MTDHKARPALGIDSRRVVHETIDGEVILIQLETGYYFSLDGVGAEVWTRVVAGLDAHAIAAELGDAAFGLLRELHAEKLVVADPEAVVSWPLPEEGAEAIVLQKYTDMEDFMLVDPVHDVDERGWPNRATTAG